MRHARGCGHRVLPPPSQRRDELGTSGLRQLIQQGHQALVIAPGEGPTEWAIVPVVRTPSFPLPGYRDFRVGRRFPGMLAVLRNFQPDVVHLASPALLGAQGGHELTQHYREVA